METEKNSDTAKPDTVKNTVENFYEQDDISRIVPGKKDVIVIHTNGKKLLNKRGTCLHH